MIGKSVRLTILYRVRVTSTRTTYLQINGSTTAAEDTLQTFQEVQLEAAEDEDEDGAEAAETAAAASSSSATLDVPEASLDNGGGNGGSERGERVKGEISMLSSPLQVLTTRSMFYKGQAKRYRQETSLFLPKSCQKCILKNQR